MQDSKLLRPPLCVIFLSLVSFFPTGHNSSSSSSNCHQPPTTSPSSRNDDNFALTSGPAKNFSSSLQNDLLLLSSLLFADNNSPAELWIVAFKGLLAYLLLSSEEVQSEALAVLLQAEAAEEENVEELISDWTNERATDVDERRHRRAIDCFEDMLEAYMVLTGDP